MADQLKEGQFRLGQRVRIKANHAGIPVGSRGLITDISESAHGKKLTMWFENQPKPFVTLATAFFSFCIREWTDN